MKNKTPLMLLTITVLFSIIISATSMKLASANFFPEQIPSGIKINSAGDVEGTDLIQRSGKMYTLKGDISRTIAVMCDGITLDGAGYTLKGNNIGTGVFLQERNRVTIKNMEISNFEYAIKHTWFSYSSPEIPKSNIISGNTVINNTYGIYISDFSKGNTILENKVANNEHGIYLGSCSNNILRGNQIDNNNYNFFVGAQSLSSSMNDIDQSNTINNLPIIYWLNQEGKSVPNNAGYIALIDCNEMIIQNLHLSHNGQAMLLVGLTNSIISNNTITENTNGIWLVKSQNNHVTENVINDNVNDAVYVVGSTNNHFNSNTITGNGWDGVSIGHVLGNVGRSAFRFTGSSNNNIIGNKITGNGEGINLQSSNDNAIGNNFLENNDGSAIHLYRSTYNNITANTIRRNHGSGVKLWSSNQTTVYSNFILNNSLGISLDSAANNHILQNMIANNTGFGIQLESASDKILCSIDNTIVQNNFINNQQQEGLDVSIPGLWVYPGGFVPGVGNSWDNGLEGNYWSEYKLRYPYASEVANTGVGDTSYFINENNIDHYPLLAPIDITLFNLSATSPYQESQKSEFYPTTPPDTSQTEFSTELAGIIIVIISIICVGFFVFFKKYKRR